MLASFKETMIPLLSKTPQTNREVEQYLDEIFSFLKFMLTCGARNVRQADMNCQMAALFQRFPATLPGVVQELMKVDNTYRDVLLRVLFDLSTYQDVRDRLNMHLRHAEHISINRWSKTLHPHWRSIVCYCVSII